MTISPIPAADVAPDAHQKLTQAHYEAATLARLLHKLFSSAFQPDLAEARVRALELGLALDAVGRAERVCGHCSGRDHAFPRYEEMLDHHRQAYLKFERLSSNVEDNPTLCSADTGTFASDIGHHLDAAEAAHQASLHDTGSWIGSEHELQR